MRAIALVYGEDKVEELKRALLQFDMVVILHVVDTDLFSTSSKDFTGLVESAEENAKNLEEALRMAGKVVRVDTVWGPVKEKLRNAMKLWDAGKVFVTKSNTQTGKKMQKELGRMRGVIFV